MSAIDVGLANFDDVVLRGSATRPVLVDFWAPWCAPCRALAPALERLAREFAGRFTLAKLNTDDEQALAARYGIRGIPCCKLFVDGAVADEFAGALPEKALREFLDRALPSPAAALVAEANKLLKAGHAAAALSHLDAARAADPLNEAALLTRVETLLALDRPAEAAEVIATLESPQRSRERPVRDDRRLAVLKARTALAAAPATELAELARRVAAHPVDPAAKLAYARALAAAGEYERALAELLALVAANRAYGDDAGRKTMLTIFEALGNDSDLARRYRRELAAAINR